MNPDIQQARNQNESLKKLGQREVLAVVKAIIENKVPLDEAGAEEVARIVGGCPCGEFLCVYPEQNLRLRETIFNAQAIIATVRGAA